MDNLLEYENLIHSIVNKFKSFSDKDDLFQVGMLGLISAYKNYDESLETKFSTYAYYYIYGEINKYVRESKCIKVSKDLVKLNKSIEKCKEVMRQRLKREPTTTEISLILEIEEEKIKEAQLATLEVKSLDYTYNEEDINLYNSVKIEDKETSPSILDLKEELFKLSGEERNIILARYYQDLSQTEVGKELGMSQVQVSRTETKILQKLKSKL